MIEVSLCINALTYPYIMITWKEANDVGKFYQKWLQPLLMQARFEKWKQNKTYEVKQNN